MNHAVNQYGNVIHWQGGPLVTVTEPQPWVLLAGWGFGGVVFQEELKRRSLGCCQLAVSLPLICFSGLERAAFSLHVS